MMHSSGVDAEEVVDDLVSKCVHKKEDEFCKKENLTKKDSDKLKCDKVWLKEAEAQRENLIRKDGIEIDIPPKFKEVPQASVASAFICSGQIGRYDLSLI
jgi:hypothetical protein